MPRGPRLDVAGALHHVMARGIERREIFVDDRDREDLLARIAGLLAATGRRIFAWCLIPNHFQLLVRSGAARVDRNTDMRYTHLGSSTCDRDDDGERIAARGTGTGRRPQSREWRSIG